MKRSLCVISCVAAAVLMFVPLAVAQQQKGSSNAQTKSGNVEQQQTMSVAYLGVGVEPLHPAFWSQMPNVLEHKQGVLVAEVAKGSPAEKAGVKPMDILMSYGDQRLFSPDQLAGLVQTDKSGHNVKLGIVREGKSQEITVTLGEHTVGTPTAWAPSWQLPRFSNLGAPAGNKPDTAWESFDSMTLKSLGNNRYKVDIGYQTKEGKIDHRAFEGTREEIHRDILAQADLPANERGQLLRTLDLPGADLPYALPSVFYTPDGQMIWVFNDWRDRSPILANQF